MSGLDGTVSVDELRQRRQAVAKRVAELTFDLGGLTYEMANHDHYRLDVLSRRAAELRAADAELGELERLLAGAQDGVVGQCRRCAASHSRGAVYCWRCGEALAYAVPLVIEATPPAQA